MPAATSPKPEPGAEAIRVVRTLRNMPQHELARLVGVSHAELWKYENGRKRPEPDVLRRIWEALSS